MKLTTRLVLGICLIALAIITTRLVIRRHALAPPTLHLNTTTQAILANADRVEVFRLADFHEGESRSEADLEIMQKQRLGSLDDYTILRVAPPQNRKYASRLLAALSTAKDPAHSPEPSCFDPGLGFRAWRGGAHTDAVVCFYCSGVDIITKDAGGHESWHAHADLGQARPALLALSRTAFPDDPALHGLKGEE